MAKEKQKEKIKCTCCGKDKDLESGFYRSYSHFHKATGRFHVCKECFWEFVSDDIEKLKVGLRMIDKPFLTDLLESSKDESEKTNKNLIKIYMKNVVMPQNKNLTWDDSSFDDFKSSKSINKRKVSLEDIEDESTELNKDELKFLTSVWGKGFEIEDLIWLQTEYEEWTDRYECDSKGMETLIQEICLTRLDVMNRRAAGEKVDQQLKTLQDLLGSSNLKPVQETGANAVEQETFGTLIKKFENDKPIPEPDEKWKDVDGIKKYIRIFFTGHLARMLGIKNESEDEYWEEINKFTIEEPTDENDEDLDHDKL